MGVHVWNGEAGGRSREPRTIRIEDGRIAGIGDGRSLRDDCDVIERDGATAIPGLIDAHVHLWLDPEIARPEDQDRVLPDERRRAMETRAASMVRAGITTARDLGGPDGSEIGLRDRIAREEILGPRLRCAGQPLTTRRGHCWFWGGEAEAAAEIDEVVDRQVGRGCDWIKVMATGGITTRGTRPGAAQYTAEQLRDVVSTASRHGRPVAAHAHGTAGIRIAAEAGVDTVEHCSFVGAQGGFGSEAAPDCVELLASRGVAVSPTINAGWRRFEEKDGAPGEMFTRMRAALGALRAAGVALIASTDAGIPGVRHDQLPQALAVFARFADLTPVEALRSATGVSADALGLGDTTGRLLPGLAADVLVLDGDPTETLEALTRPAGVLARGRWIPQELAR